MKPLFKYLLLATVLYTALFFTFNYIVPFNPGSITADSGWDSDYDSGGSDWGGSDYDGYSGSGGSGGYGSYSMEPEVSIYMCITLFAVVVIVNSSLTALSNLKDDKENYLKMFIFTIVVSILFTLTTIGFFYTYIVSGIGDSDITLFIIINVIIFLVSLIVLNSITPQYLIDKYKTMYPNTYNDDGSKVFKLCSTEDLEKAAIKDVEKLKETLYQIFVDVQMAWMEFDYDALAKLCSDELYNSYKSDLEILKVRNGKNIMSDFNIVKIGIIEAEKDEIKTTVKMVLEVTFHDYVINELTGKVIRGKKSTIMDNAYILEYVKYNKALKECPSCGAKIEKASNKKCAYCGSVITNNTKNYVLTHKERI